MPSKMLDKLVEKLIKSEEKRQREGLELIPSENYVSEDVLTANGSVFTNKYSEGYPGRRYYGGQENTDAIERLAIERACKLFNCKFANVQPHSGAPANLAVYAALLEPGDTVLGMDLSHGGHLTHGHPMTLPAKIYNFVRYKMKDPETGEIDYEDLRRVAIEKKPKIILAGFSAYSRTLDYKKFVEIAREVGAITMADMAHIAGLIAAGALRNPFDDGFDIITSTTHKTLRGPRGGLILTRENEEIAKKIDKTVFPGIQGGPHMHTIAGKAVAFGEALTPKFKKYAVQVLKNAKAMEEVLRKNNIRMIGGGTDNHLILADVFGSLGVTGKEAQTVFDEVGITLNMNMIADDPRKPMDPSGIRFGTPAITTRGFKEKECKRVAELMISVLKNKDDKKLKESVHKEIKALAKKFPIPKKFV
ncbi:serine hydroxymethyltransferase [Candidatus Nomurabacteria bacterium RIFCSPHIGHO2_01_FULL_39_220]|uniref:Serine hydroxymethyltransferase n=1 Tax=Candidatus Nomurabacteria bacterium RIFCSPLOWO2_02_FULL_40_67 TaxID=1801787 RepID=A0A1F6Y454_9BACT|nr:MAG: serine hydroxymethyltransferase [Parcubacteria group bacterium GW2011_GWA2_40_37]OGI62067.1 MAG: serine hydroxymethyltransferase [Candidatus Nomurabacteria bacterium RBG_16_40_11]OGI70282.1 MAG: serine hydroxymethyltransferase [Candidatus Nomurabacteria bacterium RIFCSPHIGHO2_01_FULL_39_220]OGI73485.1 MAG: serine hydroxymethyltransferase [Candidatus Nomurabacteria bacterium RIFCSPHIGHO2_02_41_18]OGI78754.1 MAG: serine hydroxymethyltransferase [Candidatus Nomurabacteria bacterium RIFCSPH